MASGDKTVFDPGATVPEGDKTEIRIGDLTAPGADETVLEGDEQPAYRDSASAFAKGDIILDTYRVEDDAIEAGGMGRVWQVHHTGWNTDETLLGNRTGSLR